MVQQLTFLFEKCDTPDKSAPRQLQKKPALDLATAIDIAQRITEAETGEVEDKSSSAQSKESRAPGENLESKPGGSKRRALHATLAKYCDLPLRLIVHDNRSTMISSAKQKGVLTLRMHHMFLEADETQLKAVALFVSRSDRRAKVIVDDYIERHSHLISRAPKSPRSGQGQHHDLESILADLNHQYFAGKVEAEICFGRAGRPQRQRRSSIKLGSYDDAARSITIHPALDQKSVPRVFVEYIVFHEMLHQVLPPVRRGASMSYHNAAFRRAERQFLGRREAESWYSSHQDLLLRYREKRILALTRKRP